MTTEQLPPPTGGDFSPQAEAERLRRLLLRQQARWRQLSVLRSGALTLIEVLAYLWIAIGLDSVLHFPVWARWVVALVLLALVVTAARGFAAAWRRSRITEDEVALAIERETAGALENRVINTLQLSRCADATAEAAAAVRENCRRLKDVALRPAVRVGPVFQRVGLALALVLAGLALWRSQPERFASSATRILLPFAQIDPVYRTVLQVLPGDVEARLGETVRIRIRIRGRIPATLSLRQNAEGDRSTIELPVPRGQREVEYAFEDVRRTIGYSVRGGDYTTPTYMIFVPVPPSVRRARVTIRYPEYTRLPERVLDVSGGDLAALVGAQVTARLTLDRPLEKPRVVLEAAAAPEGEEARVQRISPTELDLAFVVGSATGYRLEGERDGRSLPPRRYAIRVLVDEAPTVQLEGLGEDEMVSADAVMSVTMTARDDFGLRAAGLFFRPAAETAGAEAEWTPVTVWQDAGQGALAQWATNLAVPVEKLNAWEGDAVELCAMARDYDPAKGDAWQTGSVVRVMVGGEATALQRTYERILQGERDLRALAEDVESAAEEALAWSRRLDAEPARYREAGGRAEVEQAVAAMTNRQAALRERASALARTMAEEAGTLRVSVGMLADTEMVRGLRILDSVLRRETPQDQSAALSDARLTGDRVARSLRAVLDQYVVFRQDWELAHMTAFTLMLAERQSRMATDSTRYAQLPPETPMVRLKEGAERRQRKMGELTALAQTALAGLGPRLADTEPLVAAAFTNAAAAVDRAGVKERMKEAAKRLARAEWTAAAPPQEQAAEALKVIHGDLVRAQADAVRQALAALQELARDDVKAQAELAELKPGGGQTLADLDPAKASLEELALIRRLSDELKKRRHPPGGAGDLTYLVSEEMAKRLQGAGDEQQELEDVFLAKTSTGQFNSPNQSDRESNPIKPFVQDEVYDLIGDLIEEVDDLQDKYDTYNLTYGLGIREEGEIKKQQGDINSSAANAFTGNQKQPTHNFGGVSRPGRQGARAHGRVVGDESVNRRGRDQAQEGQLKVEDQDGSLTQRKSDDPQPDVSTGIGGRDVEGEEPPSFSLKDAGEWKDEMADRMKAPGSKQQIVERKGKPLDFEVAQALRDLESKQEQIIERIKAVKKDLDNLYLPSDQLDEMTAQLRSNLERLVEKPDAELFREQMATLDRLRGALVVFNRPASEFQPSLAREQRVGGDILDEPPWRAVPGYEDAVKAYYEKLANP